MGGTAALRRAALTPSARSLPSPLVGFIPAATLKIFFVEPPGRFHSCCRQHAAAASFALIITTAVTAARQPVESVPCLSLL